MLLHTYVGDDGVAHKVTKGYIGVNGVAKKIYEPVKETLFYKRNEIYNFDSSYSAEYGQPNKMTLFFDNKTFFLYYNSSSSTSSTSLCNFDENLVYTKKYIYYRIHDFAVMNDNAILFNSGSNVYSINNDFVVNVLGSLKESRPNPTAGNIGDYVLFAGGYKYTTYSTFFNYVDVYDNNFIHSTIANLDKKKYKMNANFIDDYLLLVGGEYPYDSSTQKPTNEIEIYDINLVKLSTKYFQYSYFYSYYGKRGMVSCKNNNYVLFTGGYGPSSNNYTSSFVFSVDKNLIINNDIENLKSLPMFSISSYTTFKNYIIFFCKGEAYEFRGLYFYASTDTWYNENLILEHSDILHLSVPREAVMIGIENYILFIGGRIYNSDYKSIYKEKDYLEIYEYKEIYN